MSRFKLEMIFEMEDGYEPPNPALLIQAIAGELLTNAPPGASMNILQPPVVFEVVDDD